MIRRAFLSIIVCLGLFPHRVQGAEEGAQPDTSRGDTIAREFLRQEVEKLESQGIAAIQSLDEWKAKRDEVHLQLRDMLGLNPWPEKTPLNATITGTVEHDEFTVENLHFQSRPGLYVTANLYLPKERDKPLPAVLYVCGHGRVVKDGVSYGNKSHYQHHGALFARHGYVCLTIDTIQLGEIEGLHHGTYREGMWWWYSRGYTPAGVEAWNGIRALDYLESRPEVDGERLGITGRSGGGAYSWWVAALDERVKAAVPVAGITSMRNHVIDDCIEGHCDCMFMVNTYQWDFPTLASLVAPRALLISNTDKDRIFPVDGVYDVFMKTRKIYDLYDADNNLGFHITEGGHKDTQELRIHAFVWFDRFLKKEDRVRSQPAEKLFQPEQLKVFDTLPEDERVTTAHEWFVAKAEAPAVPESTAAWAELRDSWMSALEKYVFRNWPAGDAPALTKQDSVEKDGVRLTSLSLAQPPLGQNDVLLLTAADVKPADLKLLVVNVLDQQGWDELNAALAAGFPDRNADKVPANPDAWQETRQMLTSNPWGMLYLAPVGVGPTELTRDRREHTHLLRRFGLLGHTVDGLRVWNVVQALKAIDSSDLGLADVPTWLQGHRNASVWALYATLFADDVKRLDLWQLPATHDRTADEAPALLNVLRFLDLPQAVALAAERTQVILYEPAEDSVAEFARQTGERLGWEKKVTIRQVDAAGK